jgi:hypothetical protein
VKCLKSARFVVVVFAPEGSSGILKLRLGRLEGRSLVYVEHVGTGWDRGLLPAETALHLRPGRLYGRPGRSLAELLGLLRQRLHLPLHELSLEPHHFV